jgi:ribonuclease HI
VFIFFRSSFGLDISQPLLPSEPQTNNRAELRAIQAALDIWDSNNHDWPKKFTHVQIWSDSEYSLDSLTNGQKDGDVMDGRKKMEL